MCIRDSPQSAGQTPIFSRTMNGSGVWTSCAGGCLLYTSKLSPREKIRTKKRAISEMAKTMMAHVQDGADYSGKCIMSQSACREDAEAVAALIEEQVPQLKGKIEINDIGTLIGSHTGPGTVALFFMGDKRVD